MRVKNVKGIVWDLDGTLLDSFGIFEQILADVVRQSGHKMPSEEDILHNYHGSLEEVVQQILGIKSAAELDKALSFFLENQGRYYSGDIEVYLFKDATMLAQRAAKKGIKQLLVTNRNHLHRGPASPRSIIEATVLADCIHEVISGDEVEYRKPDRRSMGNWLERNGLRPEEVLFIGDQYVDAQLALNLGSRALLVRRRVDIPHLDKLRPKNHKDIAIVNSLENVELV